LLTGSTTFAYGSHLPGIIYAADGDGKPTDQSLCSGPLSMILQEWKFLQFHKESAKNLRQRLSCYRG
jgi:hypothetical protein